MMKRSALLLFVLIVSCSSRFKAQVDTLGKPTESSLIIQAESFILALQMDSALNLLDQVARKDQDDYAQLLRRIALGKEANYSDYLNMFRTAVERPDMNELNLTYFMDEAIVPPASDEAFELDYGELRFYQVSWVRDAGDMSRATEINEALKDYTDRFDQTDRDVMRIQCLLKVHDLVQACLQVDLESATEISKEMDRLAEKVGDTDLKIAVLLYSADIKYYQQDLEGYIAMSEEAYTLEHSMDKPSQFYTGIMTNLINALVFQGNNPKRIEHLLREFYEYPKGRPYSYSLYAQYLQRLPEGDSSRLAIYEQFGVETMEQLADKLVEESKGTLDPNNSIYILTEFSKAFKNTGDLEHAYDYLRRGYILTKNTYAQDLSQSLADFHTRTAVKEKESEIEREKAQSRLYTVVAIMAGLLLMITLVAFVRQSRQARLLAARNKEIAERDAEKALLLKEIHHRVKNNFQIVSSLLEMQIRNIDDAQAREVATEGQNRVKSMALIHQRLYQNEDLVIHFDEYTQKLVSDIAEMYGSDKDTRIQVKVPDLAFDIDTAIPLGLILNELVSNAFKYGFAEEQRQLEVMMQKEDDQTYRLEVRDNGTGLDPSIDVGTTKTLGLRLVRRLAKQLEGSLSYSSEGGSVFTVLFKDTAQRVALG